MTLKDIKIKHEQLFAWVEVEFQERCRDSERGDPMEAANLMWNLLTNLTAIEMGERPGQ